MNFSTVMFLLFLANITRDIEKKNLEYERKISKINEQININEIEYNLHNNYQYLKKLQKIYFDYNSKKEISHNRISIQDIAKDNLENIYRVGIK